MITQAVTGTGRLEHDHAGRDRKAYAS